MKLVEYIISRKDELSDRANAFYFIHLNEGKPHIDGDFFDALMYHKAGLIPSENWLSENPLFVFFQPQEVQEQFNILITGFLEEYPLAIAYVHNPTKEMADIAKRDPEAFLFIDKEIATQQDYENCYLEYSFAYCCFVELGLVDKVTLRETRNKYFEMLRYGDWKLFNSFSYYQDPITDVEFENLDPEEKEILLRHLKEDQFIKFTDPELTVKLVKEHTFLFDALTEEQYNTAEVREIVVSDIHERLYLYKDLTFKEAMHGVLSNQKTLLSLVENYCLTTKELQDLFGLHIIKGHELTTLASLSPELKAEFRKLLVGYNYFTSAISRYKNPSALYIFFETLGYEATIIDKIAFILRNPVVAIQVIDDFDDMFSNLYFKRTSREKLTSEYIKSLIPSDYKDCVLIEDVIMAYNEVYSTEPIYADMIECWN